MIVSSIVVAVLTTVVIVVSFSCEFRPSKLAVTVSKLGNIIVSERSATCLAQVPSTIERDLSLSWLPRHSPHHELQPMDKIAPTQAGCLRVCSRSLGFCVFSERSLYWLAAMLCAVDNYAATV